MNLKELVIIIFMVCIPQSGLAKPPVESIKFSVRDADTNARLVSKIEIDNIELKGGEYELQPNQDSRIAINIRADAGSEYYTRTITVFLEGFNKSSLPFNIYLSQKKPGYIYNRGTVKKASDYINKVYADRAVALLERINMEIEPSLMHSQFGVHLKYNIARAYLANCTLKFVDQCMQAKEIFDSLLSGSESEKQWVLAERISVNELKNITVSRFYNRMKYLRALWDIKCNRYSDAKKAFQQLLNKATTNPEIFGDIDRNQEGLKQDIRYVETLIKEASAD